jgi:hypothetical protein
VIPSKDVQEYKENQILNIHYQNYKLCAHIIQLQYCKMITRWWTMGLRHVPHLAVRAQDRAQE